MFISLHMILLSSWGLGRSVKILALLINVLANACGSSLLDD